MFGTLGLPALAQDDARRLVDAALDAGIVRFDTADSYGKGESERGIGELLAGVPRASIEIVSKVGLVWDGTRAVADLEPRAVRTRVEASLERLGLDSLDVVLAHMPDTERGIDEVTATMAALVAEGTVKAYGWSNFPIEDVVAAHYEARLAGTAVPTALQCQYNVLERSAEDGLFAAARRLGYEISVWGPLASGWLTESATSTGAPSTSASRARSRRATFDPQAPGNRRRVEVIGELALVAEELGMPIHRLAVAFVLAHRDVSRVVIGPSSLDELREYVAAAAVELPREALERIDAIVAPGSTVNPADIAWRRPVLDDLRAR